MMKYILAIASILLVAAVAVPSGNAQTAAAKSTPEGLAKAKKLYTYDCAMCHGDKGDGKGDTAKDLKLEMVDYTDAKTLADKKDQELFDIIRKGKGKMPPEEEGRAKDAEVWNLIVLVRSFAKSETAAN